MKYLYKNTFIMRRIIITESQFKRLIENIINDKKIIAYHGSTQKFNRFDYEKRGKYGQTGSELGFWFVTDKRIANRFAQIYPDEMYDKLNDMRKRFNEKEKKELGVILKNIDIQPVLKFLEDDNNQLASDKLKRYVEYKNYKEIDEFLYSFFSFYGRKNIINTELYDVFDEYDSTKLKYNELRKTQEEKIKDWYDRNHKGYLYTVELNLKELGEENGEDIGTLWGRHGTIAQYEEEGYDGVLIKFADTGQGLGDEIVVFDKNNIKIKKIEEV